MQFVAIQNQGSVFNCDFRVHREGCKDIGRDRGKCHSNGYTITGQNVDAAIAADVTDYQATDQGYSPDCYEVLPCCR